MATSYRLQIHSGTRAANTPNTWVQFLPEQPPQREREKQHSR
jgi:hypothetical protein